MNEFELKQQIINESTFIEEFTVTFDRAAGWFCEMLILFDKGSKKIESYGKTESEAVRLIIEDYLKFMETDC